MPPWSVRSNVGRDIRRVDAPFQTGARAEPARPEGGTASGALMRARDLNWMQVEEYLARDDRVVLPLGSTEQHGYLSLETDNILAERVSVEAAEPLGVLVLPVLSYGLTPYFAAAYPGSPTLRLETFLAVIRDLLDSLYGQGFRRFLLVNGHGGKTPAGPPPPGGGASPPDGPAIFPPWGGTP